MTLLPVSLFALVQCFLLSVEARQLLSLGTISDLNTSTLPSPPTFDIPARNDITFVSVAFCAPPGPFPRFFVTNDTTVTQPTEADVDNTHTFEIPVSNDGFGSWAGYFINGGILAVQSEKTGTPFELLVSAASECLYPSITANMSK